MPVTEEFKLKKFVEFLRKFNTKDQHLFYVANTIRRYFYLAEIQAQSFKEKTKLNFLRNSEKDYSIDCDSCCFAFYNLIRTSLEAARTLTEEMMNQDQNGVLASFREKNKKDIKRIIDIANDFIKHPLATIDKDKFYQPGGLDFHHNVTIYEYSKSDPNYFQLPEINPIKDLHTIYQYLEDLGTTYLLIIA